MNIWYRVSRITNRFFDPRIEEIEVIKETETRVYFPNDRYENKKTNDYLFPHRYFRTELEALQYCIEKGEKIIKLMKIELSETERKLSEFKKHENSNSRLQRIRAYR